jgi:hypothetical protein
MSDITAVYQEQREILERKISYLEQEVKHLQGKLLSGLKTENFSTWKNSLCDALQYYVEAMYMAYLKETGLPPTEVVLRTGIIDGKDREIYYFFEPKSDKNIRKVDVYTNE